MAGNQQEVKAFTRSQRDLIAQEMKTAFRSSALFKSLYPIQQTIGQDALLLRYRNLNFEYKQNGTKLIFETVIPIAGTEDLKIKVRAEVEEEKINKA